MNGTWSLLKGCRLVVTARSVYVAAALDVDPQYWDLQIAFFSGLPDTRLARMRWDIFRKQVKEQRPEVLVRRELLDRYVGVVLASNEVFRFLEHPCIE